MLDEEINCCFQLPPYSCAMGSCVWTGGGGGGGGRSR